MSRAMVGLILYEGQHGRILSRIAAIDKIPVGVKTCHEKWLNRGDITNREIVDHTAMWPL